MPGLNDFSTDAGSNDVAAPPIFFGEGQPAATVNNSMRELMAALARWRDDNAGAALAVRGAGDVYNLATNQIFGVGTIDNLGSATRSHTIAFTVDANNQGPSKLSLDGCPAKPLRRRYFRELAPGDLSPGVVYRASYLPFADAYLIVAPSIDRPGKIEIQGNAPTDAGWLACDGAAVSRTAYAALFSTIGTIFGAGDGSNTFNLPNFNGGRAPMGPGLSGAGGIGGTLGSAGGSETVTLSASQMPSHSHSGSTGDAGSHDHGGQVLSAGAHSHGGFTIAAGGHGHSGTTGAAGGHSHTGTTDTGGAHSHIVQYGKGLAGSGGSNAPMVDLFPTASGSAGQTDTNGAHQHGFATSDAPDHQHSFATSAVADHQHPILSDGTHQHAIPGVGGHSHVVTINATGGDGAHSNMPPGLVVAFVIKA